MKLFDLPQGSPDWLEWRYFGVGASDIAAIIGISPFADATREKVLAEKVARQGREASFAMRRGQRLEPVARAAYQQRRPCEVRVCCVAHDLYPWALASLDGLCNDDAGELWVLELKCPNKDAHAEALAGLVPYYYQPQCQWQLFVTGLTRLDYVSYTEHSMYGEADRLAVVPVERDEGVIAMLVNEAAAFWMDVLDARLKGVPACG